MKKRQDNMWKLDTILGQRLKSKLDKIEREVDAYTELTGSTPRWLFVGEGIMRFIFHQEEKLGINLGMGNHGGGGGPLKLFGCNICCLRYPFDEHFSVGLLKNINDL